MCGLAIALLLIGCQLPEAKPSVAAPHAMMQPTEADRLMVGRYDVLMAELDEGIAREIFNHFRSSSGPQQWRRHIAAGEPMSERALGQARRYFTQQIEAAEASRRWPEPVGCEVMRAVSPIKVDGLLDEPAWQAGQSVTLRYIYNQPEPIEAGQADVRAIMLWDDDALYVAFMVPDEDIRAPELPDDDFSICTFDCVELFLMPRSDWGIYWEINASPTGPLYDALNYWNPDAWMSVMRRDLNLDGLQLKAERVEAMEHTGGPGYVVELAFPWSQLPLPAGTAPAAGDVYHGLLAVSQRDSEVEEGQHRFLSHSPMLATYHNIRTFAPFELMP